MLAFKEGGAKETIVCSLALFVCCAANMWTTSYDWPKLPNRWYINVAGGAHKSSMTLQHCDGEGMKKKSKEGRRFFWSLNVDMSVCASHGHNMFVW